MRTSIINADKAKKYRIFYKICGSCCMDYGMAADQYVAETGDPSGISCFCYKETYRIDCNGRFLEICGVQFRKDYTGIFSGFDPGNGSGGAFFCFFLLWKC